MINSDYVQKEGEKNNPYITHAKNLILYDNNIDSCSLKY
jgi:hypothetical protein